MQNLLNRQDQYCWDKEPEICDCPEDQKNEVAQVINIDGDLRIYYECQVCGNRHYEE